MNLWTSCLNNEHVVFLVEQLWVVYFGCTRPCIPSKRLLCYCWPVCLVSGLVPLRYFWVLCPGLSCQVFGLGLVPHLVLCLVLRPGATLGCVLGVSMYPLRCYFWVLCPVLSCVCLEQRWVVYLVYPCIPYDATFGSCVLGSGCLQPPPGCWPLHSGGGDADSKTSNPSHKSNRPGTRRFFMEMWC